MIIALFQKSLALERVAHRCAKALIAWPRWRNKTSGRKIRAGRLFVFRGCGGEILKGSGCMPRDYAFLQSAWRRSGHRWLTDV